MKRRPSKGIARPLGVRGHQKPSYVIASHKAGGAVFVEVPAESTTLLALEVDPRVVSISTQPFTVRLDSGQLYPTRAEALSAEPRSQRSSRTDDPPQERIYTPDFHALLATQQEWAVESKSAREVQNLAAVLARRGAVINELGFHFLVVASNELDQFGLHVNLVNLRDAMKHQRSNDTRVSMEQLGHVVSAQQEEFTLGDVRAQLSDLSIYLGLVSGVIACDLRSGHIGMTTVLRKAYGDLAHLQLLRFEA